MLQSKDVDERWAAVALLVPLGKAPPLVPLLEATARNDRRIFYLGGQLLPWLVWEERLKLFGELRRLAPDADGVATLLRQMAEIPDRRLVELFWQMLADPSVTPEQASAMEDGILVAYHVERWNFNPSGNNAKNSRQKRLARDVEARLSAGTEMQRLVALCLLTYGDSELAYQRAKQLEADAKASQALRNDAFQISLAMAPKKEAVEQAVAALSDSQSSRKKLALAVLVQSQRFDSMQGIRGHLEISQSNGRSNLIYSRTSGTPIIPEAPKGLKAGQVEPLLSDRDPEVAAQAGYLLALLGEPRGLDPLLRQLRSADKSKRRWQWLTYRAIAALDDSSHLAVLREIYAALEEGERSDFYWTVRIMTGPEVLEFRKQIRDEVGINNLR
jgi:hypothetical protein